MKIKILATGGTIDKIYSDQKSEFQVGDSQVDIILKEANISFEYEIRSLMRKDSLDMDDTDRQCIRDAVMADPDRHIVITHGTDTMADSARFLANIPGKVIVFTGAMQPARFRMTDAIYNIASAMMAVQILPEGVYIAMNGCVFNGLNVRKNAAKNRFEPLTESVP